MKQQEHTDKQRFIKLVTEHENTLVLTASHRQSRCYVKLVSEHLSQLNQSWLTPKIYSLDNWIMQNDAVLDDQSSKLLWQLALKSCATDNWLDNLQPASRDRLISLAMEAAHLCSHWRIDPNPNKEAFSEHQDWQFFTKWYKEFNSLCRATGLYTIDAYIANFDKIDNRLSTLRIRRIVIAGFVELTPLQKKLIECLNKRNIDVIEISPNPTPPEPHYVTCDQSQYEIETIIEQIAKWYENNERATIALVVPNLSEQWSRVFSIMNRRFNQNQDSSTAFAYSKCNFNLSGGLPLASMPFIDTALRLIGLNGNSSLNEIEELLSLPLIDLGASEVAIHKCQQLINNGYQATIEQVAKRFNWQWLDSFTNQQYWREGYPSELIERIKDRLRRANWLAQISLNSNEYQQCQKWQQILDNAAKLDRINQPLTMTDIITFLKDTTKVAYQPQSDNADIQVLGLYESIGLWFDKVMIVGMTERVLPLPVRPSPFIPTLLQRKFGIWNSNHQSSHDYSKKIWHSLLSTAKHIQVSYAKNDEDRINIASPLISQLPSKHHSNKKTTLPPIHKEIIASEKLLPPTADKYPSSLLEHQSACSFQAVLRHRFGISAEQKQPYYNALDTGILAHTVLEQCHDGSCQQSEAEIRELLANELDLMTDKGHWLIDSRAAKQIHQQLTEQLYLWISNDKGHKIIERELQCQVKIDALYFSFRIDRIDKLPNDGLVIIDYKTGNIGHKNWLGLRPKKPQLIAYALALSKKESKLGNNKDLINSPISGFGFASLKQADYVYRLMGDNQAHDHFIENAWIEIQWEDKSLQREAWQENLKELYQEITNLAKDFASGEVLLNPTNNACKYCDYKSICRIQEKQTIDYSTT